MQVTQESEAARAQAMIDFDCYAAADQAKCMVKIKKIINDFIAKQIALKKKNQLLHELEQSSDKLVTILQPPMTSSPADSVPSPFAGDKSFAMPKQSKRQEPSLQMINTMAKVPVTPATKVSSF